MRTFGTWQTIDVSLVYRGDGSVKIAVCDDNAYAIAYIKPDEAAELGLYLIQLAESADAQ